MSAASDYLRQQITLAASKKPTVTFVSCQRSLAPSAAKSKPSSVASFNGVASYGWGINGTVQKNAAGDPDGLYFPEVIHWFSDRITNPGASPPDYQQFAAGPYTLSGGNRDRVSLTFKLATIPRFQVAPTTEPELSGTKPFAKSVWDWLMGDAVVELTVVLRSHSNTTWQSSTSELNGPSQQLVFNIPGTFKIPAAGSGAPPAVMLTSFHPTGEFGFL